MAYGRKTGGRKKGSVNKVSTPKREQIAKLSSIERIYKDIAKVREKDPGKAADLEIKLLEFIMAKKKEVEVSGNENKSIQVEVVRRKD